MLAVAEMYIGSSDIHIKAGLYARTMGGTTLQQEQTGPCNIFISLLLFIELVN